MDPGAREQKWPDEPLGPFRLRTAEGKYLAHTEGGFATTAERERAATFETEYGQRQTEEILKVFAAELGTQIGTRFEIAAPGDYRVFYRAVRRNARAFADVLIDGKTLAPRASNTPAALSDTRLAGIAKLSTGKHSLTIRPRKGEDIRADFVILANDPTIGGYRFAVKPDTPH